MVDENKLTDLQLREHIVSDVPPSARGAPYWVRGRDHEIAQIVTGLTDLPRPITLIMGAPGTGKSTLLYHIQCYAEKMGCKVVRLEPSDFQSNADLTDAIREVKDDSNSASDRAEQNLGGSLRGRILGLLSGTISGGMRWARNTTRGWAWRQALTQLAQLHPKGIVFVIDEAQEMSDNLKDDNRSELVKSFMNTIHSRAAMTKDRKITLIGGGLPNTQRVFNSFKMTRIENNDTLRLGPLTERASRQVLQDHVTAETKQRETLPIPTDALIGKLIEDCGGCAHHLSWAGWRIQEMAKQIMAEGRTMWSDDDEEQVVERLQRDREGLYVTRVRSDDPRAVRITAYVLATATERWGEQLPEGIVLAVADKVAQMYPEQAVEDIVTTLEAKGVLEHRDRAYSFLTRTAGSGGDPHYVFPIHSLLTWIRTQRLSRSTGEWTDAKGEAVLNELFGPAGQESQIPTWDWDDSTPLPPLPDGADLIELASLQEEEQESIGDSAGAIGDVDGRYAVAKGEKPIWQAVKDHAMEVIRGGAEWMDRPKINGGNAPTNGAGENDGQKP